MNLTTQRIKLISGIGMGIFIIAALYCAMEHNIKGIIINLVVSGSWAMLYKSVK